MSERILVVDDTRDSRNIMSMLLTSMGYTVVQAANGGQALEQVLGGEAFDLILLDVRMPEIDGYKVCETLKRNMQTSHIPVIFISAAGDQRDKIRGLETGGVDYITIPFDKNELRARVQSQLKIGQLTRELRDANVILREKQDQLDEDLRAAAQIQRSLLPTGRPLGAECDVAWKFLPCDKIAGDIFNIFRLDKEHVGLYMLDVSGHGPAAALVTASVAQMLQPQGDLLLARRDARQAGIASPAAVLGMLDAEFPIERFDKYFTISYMTINLRTGLLTASTAAHPAAVIIRQGGGMEILEKGGPIIGVGEVSERENETKTLAVGDRVIVYTDGLVEARNNNDEPFGEHRLFGVLDRSRAHSVQELVQCVETALVGFVGVNSWTDDVSVLAFEYRGSV